jgi:hypothetical protein
MFSAEDWAMLMALNRSVGQSTNDAPGFRDDAADAHKFSTIATERSGRRALQHPTPTIIFSPTPFIHLDT